MPGSTASMKPRPVKMNRPWRLPTEQASSANDTWTINEQKIKTTAKKMRIFESLLTVRSVRPRQCGADSVPLKRKFLSARHKTSRVPSDHRHVHGIWPAVRRIVEDVGAAHQCYVAGASAMDRTGLSARYRS